MDEIPQEFSCDLLNSIRSGLLRVESKHRDGMDVNVCLKESYDVYARRLQEAGRTLDETLLTESIPAWVFQWAVARHWLPYPPLRPRRNNTAPTDGKYISSHEPVPEDELTVPFGCYKVTDWYKADVIKRLGSRISHWQAEALVPVAVGGFSQPKQALGKDREMRGGRKDSPELSADNANDLPEIKEQALGILGAADAQAEEMILSAIQASDGVDPAGWDLDTGAVGYAKDAAVKIRHAGNTVATELLYNAYADRHMTRASSADGFIATLDIVFQRVVGVLEARTDRNATKALRQKWSAIARDRAAAGWFVARAPKITMGAQITNPIYWGDLEKRFRDLSNEYDDRLTANWISSAWGEDGEQWCLRGGQGRESEMFRALAERAAVGLGHPAGVGALFFWLDLLKSESANFRSGYGGRDDDGNVWSGGIIRKPCEASAVQCFRQETRLVAVAVDVEPLNEPESVLGSESKTQGIETDDEGPDETPVVPSKTHNGYSSDLLKGKTVFPARAAWLKDRLRERSWNKHDLSSHGGPDHKTVQKILDGLSVREDVLEKVAKGLSMKNAEVNVLDIPQA
jgi:hypothetical protein